MSPPKLLPAVLGGLFLGVLSALPIVGAANACCCLWVVVGGALAAWVMQQNHPAPITMADGALVGLLAGAIGAVVMMIVSVPVGYLTGGQPFSTAMVPPEGMTPEMREVLSRIGPGVIVALAAIMWVGASLVFSTVGGVIGAAIFRRPAPPVVPPPAPPPPAPPTVPASTMTALPPVPPVPAPPSDPAPPDSTGSPVVPTPPDASLTPEMPPDADRPAAADPGGPDGPFERPISGDPDPDRRG